MSTRKFKQHVFFAKQLDVDAEYELRKIHRKRVPPRRLDETSETVATV